MKLLCAFAIFCVFISLAFASYKKHEQFMEASKKCVADMKLDEKAMHDYIHGRNHTTDDETKKCYFKCVLEATNWMAKGKITEPEDHGLPEELGKAFKDCESAGTGKDDCEKAYNFHMCSHNKTMDWVDKHPKKN